MVMPNVLLTRSVGRLTKDSLNVVSTTFLFHFLLSPLFSNKLKFYYHYKSFLDSSRRKCFNACLKAKRRTKILNANPFTFDCSLCYIGLDVIDDNLYCGTPCMPYSRVSLLVLYTSAILGKSLEPIAIGFNIVMRLIQC